MPRFANIEESPNYLKLLSGYGTTAVTLSLGLLTLSVAFAEKFIRQPLDPFQAVVLVLLWISLLLALLCGVMITGRLTLASANYVTAKTIADPEALERLGNGEDITIPVGDEQIKKPCNQQQQDIKEKLHRSRERAQAAVWWANRSFELFCGAAVLICLLGGYSSIYIGMRDIGEDAAINSAFEKTKKAYNLSKDDAQVFSLSYDQKEKIYTIKINSKKTAGEAYVIIVDAVSGRITNTTKAP